MKSADIATRLGLRYSPAPGRVIRSLTRDSNPPPRVGVPGTTPVLILLLGMAQKKTSTVTRCRAMRTTKSSMNPRLRATPPSRTGGRIRSKNRTGGSVTV